MRINTASNKRLDRKGQVFYLQPRVTVKSVHRIWGLFGASHFILDFSISLEGGKHVVFSVSNLSSCRRWVERSFPDL